MRLDQLADAIPSTSATMMVVEPLGSEHFQLGCRVGEC
jgi:hypothetical protein